MSMGLKDGIKAEFQVFGGRRRLELVWQIISRGRRARGCSRAGPKCVPTVNLQTPQLRFNVQECLKAEVYRLAARLCKGRMRRCAALPRLAD